MDKRPTRKTCFSVGDGSWRRWNRDDFDGDDVDVEVDVDLDGFSGFTDSSGATAIEERFEVMVVLLVPPLTEVVLRRNAAAVVLVVVVAVLRIAI
jgi:hypothetical protein